MSYQIEYPLTNRLEQNRNTKARKKTMVSAVLIACAIFLTVLVYIVGLDTVKGFLIPGNDQVTVSAFNEMQENIKKGMSAMDAVVVFCEEILESANIQ